VNFSPEIDAPHIAVADDLAGTAFFQHTAVVKDVGAVDHIQGVADIVIGDQHTDAAILEMRD
jgi:hypothetical protein